MPGRIRVLGPDGALLAVAEVVKGRLSYLRVLAWTRGALGSSPRHHRGGGSARSGAPSRAAPW